MFQILLLRAKVLIIIQWCKQLRLFLLENVYELGGGVKESYGVVSNL